MPGFLSYFEKFITGEIASTGDGETGLKRNANIMNSLLKAPRRSEKET